MQRTRIPEHLIRKPAEVRRNAELFDKFVEAVPEDAYVQLIDSVLKRDKFKASLSERILAGWVVFKMIAEKAGYLYAGSTFLRLIFRSSKQRKQDEIEELLEDSRSLHEALIGCWLTEAGFEDPADKPLPENFFTDLADSLSSAVSRHISEEDAKAAFDIFKTYLKTPD